MLFAVGARFVCLKCALRAARPKCAKCGRETIDLSKQDLSEHWSLWKAHVANRRIFSPAVARHSKWLKRVALILTIVNVIPAMAMAAFKDSDRAPLSATIAGVAIGIVVFTPLTFLFYWAFLFLVALTFHAMGMLFGWMSKWMPIGQLRLRIVTVISELISRPLLGLIRIEVAELQSPAPLRGTLTAPLIIDLQRDQLAVMERADAFPVSPISVKLDTGEEQTLELFAGVIRCEQPGATNGTPQLPAWLPGTRNARRAEFQTGTRVIIRRAADGLVQLDLV